MIPISDNPPPGVVDRRDGSTKGECGITTTSCLFCKDQIAGSKSYVEKYDEMTWASKDGCQMATCPYWGKPQCPQVPDCPTLKYWKENGKWPSRK